MTYIFTSCYSVWVAYDILSDPEKRRHYDQFGESGPSQGSPFDFDSFFGRGEGGGHTFFNFDDLFKDDSFSFGDFGNNQGGTTCDGVFFVLFTDLFKF